MDFAIKYEPKIEMMRRQIKQAEAAVASTRRQRLPDISAGLEARNYTGDGSFRQGILLFSMNVPWLNTSKYRSEIQRDEAKLKAAELDLADYQLSVREEVHQLTVKIDAARREALLYRDQIIPRSQSALDSAHSGWTSNRGTFRDVLDARRMLLEGRLMYARAVAEQYQMLSELVLCCGLGDMEALQMIGAQPEASSRGRKPIRTRPALDHLTYAKSNFSPAHECAALGGGVWLMGCKPAGDGHEGHGGAQAKQKYHCPMHPTYIKDKPGDCGICGMKLVPIKEDKAVRQASRPGRGRQDRAIKVGQFYCPMDAEVVQDKPGKCPECNMNLVEKKAAPAGHEGHATSTTTAPVPGRISISLSADKRQMIGLALSKVEKRDLTNTVRTTAVVQHDETRYARIAPRFGGWVRKLHVNFTGAPVEKGQPLFTVYSPELFSTENEYLIAWRGLQQLKADASAEQRNAATNLLDSARRRLELWEIGDDEIRALEQRGTASDEMPFRVPDCGPRRGQDRGRGQGVHGGRVALRSRRPFASLAGRLGLRVRSAADETGPASRDHLPLSGQQDLHRADDVPLSAH